MYQLEIKNGIIDPKLLLAAYCEGYFPMADQRTGEINWYSPDPRAILELDEFHIHRSLKLVLKRQDFEICIDRAFEDVIKGCANRKETWISETIIRSYVELFKMGFAHSVEVWKENILVGGLYGVAIKGAFFGESMFSKIKDASKIALCYLVERLKNRYYVLLDIQFLTQHLQRFGAKEIPRSEYLKRLENALRINGKFNSEENYE